MIIKVVCGIDFVGIILRQHLIMGKVKDLGRSLSRKFVSSDSTRCHVLALVRFSTGASQSLYSLPFSSLVVV